MLDRRAETRLMCADLVNLRWKDESGRENHCVALLEDISPSGACLQLDSPMALGTSLAIEYRKVRLKGSVCYCFFQDIGYWTGIRFAPQVKWSLKRFRPRHLLDWKDVLARRRSAVRKTAQ